MTVRYRSATLGEFIEHHSYDVSRGGMFIKTPAPFPAGTLLKFEVRIAEEQRLMQGVGRVVWKREGDQAGDSAPAGMGIKFIKIDEASHAVIERLVENRGNSGPGAFDQSAPAGQSKAPSKSQRMFPEHTPSTPPVAGEAPPPPDLDDVDPLASSSPSIEAQPTTDEVVSDSEAPAGARKQDRKADRRSRAPARPDATPAAVTSARVENAGKKPAGRRWFLAVLLVLFALGLLYVLTHKSEGPSVGFPAPEDAPFVLAGGTLWPHSHAC